MTNIPAALKAIAQAKASYEAEGYEFIIEAPLPPPFEGFMADAVARRGSELVIIEFRSADLNDRSRSRFDRLAEIIGAQVGWRLDIMTYEPEAPRCFPDQEEIVRRVEEARLVVDVSPDAAVMLIWSSIEGALLRLSHDQGLAPASHVPPRTLIHDLTIHGLLSDNQAAELDDFAKHRNNIAHGMPSEPTSPERLEWLAQFALAVADGELSDLEDMIDWFRDHYISPDNAALFYDKEDGDYFWMGTGPYDAEEVLRDQFALALDADIAEAVKEIEHEGFVWACKRQLDSLNN